MSNAGYPQERRIAAIHQQSGFFVERGYRGTSSNLFEIDVIATRYAGGLDRVLIESTRSHSGLTRRVAALEGLRSGLRYERAMFVVPREVAGLDLVFPVSPLDVITATEYRDLDDRIVSAIPGMQADPALTEAWIEGYEVIDALRRAIGRSAAENDRMGQRIKRRLSSVEGDVWIESDLLVRLQNLQRQGLDFALAMDAANHWYGRVPINRGMAALNDPDALRENGAAYVQQLERLNYIKACVDAACKAEEDPGFAREIAAYERCQPQSAIVRHVHLARERIAVARYIPAVLQAFFFGLGGMIWSPGRDAEAAFLASHAGCDRETAIRSVRWFVRFVPYHRGWWRSEGNFTAMKWFPLHLHGIGCRMRDVIHAGDPRWASATMPNAWRQGFATARAALEDPRAVAPRRARVSRQDAAS